MPDDNIQDRQARGGRDETPGDFPPVIPNRRRKKDWVTQAVPVVSVIGWLTAIVFLILLERARPQQSNFFSRYFDVVLVTAWNASLVRTSLMVLVGVLLVCVVGFFFNMLRQKRKTDKYSKSIIILGLISLVAIAAVIIVFRDLLLGV